jgi:hypothetical protein
MVVTGRVDESEAQAGIGAIRRCTAVVVKTRGLGSQTDGATAGRTMLD